jgi:hypothetical protein
MAKMPRDEWLRYGIAPPFDPVPRRAVAVDGGRVAIVGTTVAGPGAGTYRVTVLRATGDTAFTRTYPFSPLPIPRDVAQRAQQSVQALTALYGQAGALAHPELNAPPVYPPVRSVRLGADQTVWLNLRRTADEFVWVVLDSTGNVVGSVGDVRFVTGGLRTVWTRASDSNETPVFTRNRVVR